MSACKPHGACCTLELHAEEACCPLAQCLLVYMHACKPAEAQAAERGRPRRHLLALDAGVGDGELDAGGDAEAVCARIRHVVRVAGDGAAQVLCQNRRAPLLRAASQGLDMRHQEGCMRCTSRITLQ